MIQVKWNKANKKHYMECGYEFTQIGDSVWVDVKDLLKSSKEKVKVQCDCCGKIYEKTMNSITKAVYYPKIYCKKCVSQINNQKSLKQRQDKMWKNITEFCESKKYKIVTKKHDITSQNSKVTYICPVHGERTVGILTLLNHTTCSECAKKIRYTNMLKSKRKNSQNRWYTSIQDICKKENYSLLSKKEDMIKTTSYITYHCDDPTHKNHTMRISNFLSGKRCPECFYKNAQKRYSTSVNEVAERIKKCGGTLLNKDDYINQATKNLRILCPKCKEEFITSLRNFTQHGGQLCPKCSHNNESIGESYVRIYLENHKIDFEKEKWFPDCRDQNPLPFDFYLPKLNTIIEFDGRQHFDEVNLFHYSLETVQKHDAIKNNYCHDHNINLIRIPYTKMNEIDDILNNKLNLHEDIV